ncbi:MULTISPECIES: hypothetical protein [Rhizobium]|uniref:Signal recognition particle n=1 Tax=Rhizobium esperanzae TaxID=1967781 RepID=A0A7W6UJP6_9HYPH|nr:MULTISPECIES: hypothetical protein [Rhizobium]MBB4439467.1 hypothetical protein [Rhizobium esperanzae]MDH6201574.1 hypothetical protein [Rhizobium leguminosarum]
MWSMKAGLTAALVAISGNALAEMNPEKEQTARGLAQIIAYSAQCGYSIDQVQLERYYLQAGLSDPGILGFIHSQIIIKRKSADASECTLAKVTAKSTGLLSN